MPILIAAAVRGFGLLHGTGTRLDRQVIDRWGRMALAIYLLMRTPLPLPSWRFATHRVGLNVLYTRLIMLHSRLNMLPARLVAGVALRAALFTLRARLVITTLPLRPVLLPVIRVSVHRALLTSRLFGQHLATDTHKEQADCSQTPDTRFHADSHCEIGPKYKTGNSRTGSTPSTLQRNLFLADEKKGDPSVALCFFKKFRPGSTLVMLAHLAPSSGQCVARGPGQPYGVGGRGWPDSAGRCGLYVRAVILVIRIGLRPQQAIAKIAG